MEELSTLFRRDRSELFRLAKTITADLVQPLNECYQFNEYRLHHLKEAEIKNYVQRYNDQLTIILDFLKREEDRKNLSAWIQSTIRRNELYEAGVYDEKEIEELKQERNKYLPKFLEFFGASEQTKA